MAFNDFIKVSPMGDPWYTAEAGISIIGTAGSTAGSTVGAAGSTTLAGSFTAGRSDDISALFLFAMMNSTYVLDDTNRIVILTWTRFIPRRWT